MASLKGRVAVVAGATRGTGRGVARALGEAGATVYCTGRSVSGNPSPYGRSETIEETAAMVTAAGGHGIAVRVDHSIEDEVRALFERVERDHGRLDVLATAVAGEDPVLGTGMQPFWETDLSRIDQVMRQLVVSHLVTAKHAATMMVRAKRGLIVEITGGDQLYGGSGGSLVQELAKTAQKGLAFFLSEELRAHEVAALAVTPGFLRSETMLEHFGVTEATWRAGGKKDVHFLHSETPLFIGRTIAALAADPHVMRRSGDIVSSWELARDYDITDADGSRPDWGEHWEKEIVPSIGWVREGLERYAALLERSLVRTRRSLGDAVTTSRATASGAYASPPPP